MRLPARSFLTIADWSADELLAMLARARDLRRMWRAGERPQTLLGRTLMNPLVMAIALYYRLFDKKAVRAQFSTT